jgi:hypothetical protein
VDYSPLLRAAIVNLDCWVSEGVDPPPSSHPRIDDGSAVPPDAVFERFDRFSGIHLPDSRKLPRLSRVDAGDLAAQGIVRVPVTEDGAYPLLVSAVDENGNEVAGIRLPDLTVPVGTHTGWNPRAPETEGADRIMSMQGSTFFFAPSRAEREAAGDPRPSLEERYTDKRIFEERVSQAAQDLVASGYLLEEDVDIVVSDSSARYDEATRNYSAFRTPS